LGSFPTAERGESPGDDVMRMLSRSRTLHEEAKRTSLEIELETLIRFAYRKVGSLLGGRGLYRFRMARAAHSVIARHLRHVAVDVQGHRMILDKEDSLFLHLKGVHEPLSTELVKSYIEPDDVVVDVGAHVGYFTLLFARIVGDGGRVFAFEPEPTNARLLRRNLRLNAYSNVEVIEAAVSDRVGTVNLYLSEDNEGDHRIWQSKSDGARRAVPVRSVALSDVFRDYPRRISFVKLDVQGAEGRALHGMKSLMERDRPTILMEFVPPWLARCGTEADRLFAWMQGMGFRAQWVDERSGKTFRLRSLEELAVDQTEGGANILWIDE
jgi:FkbM family methyltransferase